MKQLLGRRAFLKVSSAALAASAGIASAAGPKDKKIELTDKIPAREFGPPLSGKTRSARSS